MGFYNRAGDALAVAVVLHQELTAQHQGLVLGAAFLDFRPGQELLKVQRFGNLREDLSRMPEHGKKAPQHPGAPFGAEQDVPQARACRGGAFAEEYQVGDDTDRPVH